MFDNLTYTWKLTRLRRTERRVRASFNADLKAAWKAKKPRFEIDKLEDSRFFETQAIGEDISRLQTYYLLDKARRYFIDPEVGILVRDDPKCQWVENSSGRPFLITKTLHGLNAEIRKEQLERRQLWTTTIVPMISGLTGLAGAAIGLIALFKK